MYSQRVTEELWRIVLFCPGASPLFGLSFEYPPALVAPKVPVISKKGGKVDLHPSTKELTSSPEISHTSWQFIIKSSATHTSQTYMKFSVQKNFKTIDVIHHAIGNEKLFNAIS